MKGELSAKRVRVTRSFPADFFEGLTQPPMVMQPGDLMRIETEADSGSEWPAFALVETEGGERGWVPKRYLRREGSRAVALRRYDTATLVPAVGEVLTVLEEDQESGWVWCRDRDGKVGWFAIDHIAETTT